MRQKKEWIPGEGSRLAPFNMPRKDELLMCNDAYISLFATDTELRQLRKKIEARRFIAAPKKGMKTLEEVRARLVESEARFEAEIKAAHAPGVKPEDHALNLELFGSWAGALRWVLGEETGRKG